MLIANWIYLFRANEFKRIVEKLIKVKCCVSCVGDPAAQEMNWMDVPGDKLLEPAVSMVSGLFSI